MPDKEKTAASMANKIKYIENNFKYVAEQLGVEYEINSKIITALHAETFKPVNDWVKIEVDFFNLSDVDVE